MWVWKIRELVVDVVKPHILAMRKEEVLKGREQNMRKGDPEIMR